jgi:hypothetical protein
LFSSPTCYSTTAATKQEGAQLVVVSKGATHNNEPHTLPMPRAALEMRRYRPGPSTDVNLATAREPAFYEALLDTMVASRLNVLSLWAVHPWPYMIRSVEWPEATSFNSTEVYIQSSAITPPCIDTGNDSTDPTTVKAPATSPRLRSLRIVLSRLHHPTRMITSSPQHGSFSACSLPCR